MMNNLFSRVGSDCCRITMDGKTAVKTSNGYKVFDMKTKRLTNVSNFCFNVNMGMDIFFVIPTTKASIGDIIIVDGKPKCVLENKNNTEIKVIDYETNEIKVFVPEHQMFMGNLYFYGKIVNLFGNKFGKDSTKNVIKMMMMSSIFGGNNTGGTMSALGGNNALGTMMMMSMFNGDKDNMFAGLFDEINSVSEDDIDQELINTEEE